MSEKADITKEEFKQIVIKVQKDVEAHMKTPEGQQELRDYLAKHRLTREDLDKEFTI